MKAAIIALAAAASLSAAAPAFAAYHSDRNWTSREDTYQYSSVSERCQMILNHTDRFGPDEVKQCRDSLP
jgi:hypothetical protein